jgi:hypothetical protein
METTQLITDKWDTAPEKLTNFKCSLTNAGRWDRGGVFTQNGLKGVGKWVFLIEPKNKENIAPTFTDQKNFFTGLFEAEWRNDSFQQAGISRNPQREKKIIMFKKLLNNISMRADIKDTARGLEFYRIINEKGEKDGN